MSYIPFPPITPEVFSLTLGGHTFALRWYALAYIVGVIIAWSLVRRAITTPALWRNGAPLSPDQLERLMTWVILGVILGGRLGYVFLYQPGYYLENPAQILAVWQGGMAFHGGFVGVVLAGVMFCRAERIAMRPMADLMALATPPGLCLGRIANFINAELWGRPTDLPWGVAFPGDAAQACGQLVGICARHPSQLYEAALEGILLGSLLVWGVWRGGWLLRPGLTAGMFFAGYGTARFLVEFARQPDAQFISDGNPLGLALQWGGWGLTMGQVLSLPMILFGLWYLRRRAGQ